MLTPEQIAALRDAFGQISDPINDFLVQDIARRVSEAGQLTSTAAYQVWRAQQLGVSQREMKRELKKLLGVSRKEVNRLMTQSAKVGYDFDISHLPYVQALPFERNPVMQQITQAAVQLAQADFTNLTQTIGMVDPYGKALPLQDVYRSCTDYAFKQVITGATDYNTAIRQATANIAKEGVRIIDYESGVHTGMEAAVRRNMMGGLGLMQEQISAQNHDTLGANGWEISAHAASAPDHEPIQGKQYTDVQYEALNGSLQRRIGTLNCGHAAFPIILGVSSQQYTDEQLKRFRDDNAAGIDYQGRHYSAYEATQKQRQVERAIRAQKRRIQVAEAAGDKERLLTSQIRLTRLNDEYARFSRSAGLRTQRERAQVAGFGRKQAAQAAKTANTMKVSQTGGKYTVGDAEWALRREAEASEFYTSVRTSTRDVEIIAKNTGFAETDVHEIKNHIFFDKHIKWDGSIEPFDPSYDMAVAWKRLSAGEQTDADILLLKHELLESRCEKEYNLTANKAHRMATETHDWNGEIKKLYGEDGEPDGLLQPKRKT